MSDIITMVDGSQWSPSTSISKVHCHKCGNAVDTPEEFASYPSGNCPDCGDPWLGSERVDTTIVVTQPQQIGGQVL